MINCIYLGELSALSWPDWYCSVASNIVSAITALFFIFSSNTMASSTFSCIIKEQKNKDKVITLDDMNHVNGY